MCKNHRNGPPATLLWGGQKKRNRTMAQRWRVHPQHVPGLRSVLPVLVVMSLGVLLDWGYFSYAALPQVMGYLTLHMVLETLSIAVSFLVFAIGWKAHSLNPQRNVFILACGFLGVGGALFLHTICLPAHL